MRTLLIDDHKINRLYLRTLLEKNFPAIKKVDEAGSVSSAIEMIAQNEYDLIFLDMELKDGMGFDVLKVVRDFMYVIVVTSHKEYAIQAFKHNVIDYILKPIHLDEIKNAIKKVLKLQQREESSRQLAFPANAFVRKDELSDALMINHKNQYVTINRGDILFIKALGKYSEIHLSGKNNYTSYKNLKEFENVMQDTFIRIHHSYLVNFKCIVSYCRNTSHVKLSSGDEIPVSVRKREELFKKFTVF